MSKPLSAGYVLHTPSNNKRSIHFNMRHLLSLVKEHPILWLISHVHYRCHKLRQKAWYDIARCLDKEFDQLEKNEQNSIVIAVMKRWNNVRDTFFNALRHNRTRPYIHEKDLQFLLCARSDMHREYIANKTKPKMQRACVGGHASDQQFDHETSVANPLIESIEEATIISDSDVETTSNKDDDRAHYLDRSPQQAASSMSEDQSFFDSIKPTVRTLSEERKIDFRIAVMQLLKRIKARRNEASDRINY